MLGNYEVIIIDDTLLKWWIKKLYPILMKSGHMIDIHNIQYDPLPGDNFLWWYVVFKDKITRDRFDIILDKMKKSGEYDRIREDFVNQYEADKSISIATIEWAPYAGKKLKNYGFSNEILSAAFERKGYHLEYRFMPWVRCLKDVALGHTDALSLAYYSEDRAKIFAFSKAYLYSVFGFYIQADSNIAYTTLQDLKPYRIGIRRGFVNTAEFDQADYLIKDVVDDEILNLKKLALGRIDLALMDKYVAQDLLNKKCREIAQDVRFIEPPLEIKPLYLIFSKKISNCMQKLNDFNHGLDVIKKDGTIDRILKKHGVTLPKEAFK